MKGSSKRPAMPMKKGGEMPMHEMPNGSMMPGGKHMPEMPKGTPAKKRKK